MWEPRVLVVDDDEVSRLAAVGLLQSLGFVVDAAADGREAVEVSAQWPYVAIFMDCEMPEVDGYTATRQLRVRDGRNAQTPVIALTSKPRWVSLASGMDQHLAKPLRLDTLQADCVRLGLLARDGAIPSPSNNVLALDAPLLNPSVFSVTAADRIRPAELGATFTQQTTARLPELWRAINAGDGPSVKRLAHALRDRATTLGTLRVAELCDRLGQTSVDGLTILAPEIEPQLRQVLANTSAAIRAYVDGIPLQGRSNVQPADPSHADDAAFKPAKRVCVAKEDKPSARPDISGALGRHGPAVEDGPLDKAGVQRLRSEFGSSGVLVDLVDLFGSEASQRLKDIRSASEAGDTAAVSAHAHQLKGGCLTLAAVHMAEHCNQLELAANDRTLRDIALLIDEIQSDFERAHAALIVIASPSALIEADLLRDAVDARRVGDGLPNRGFDVSAP